jgi:putative phosphoesterase
MGATYGVVLVSDSHGDEKALVKLLSSIQELERLPDAIFHMGDFVTDGQFLEQESGIPVVCVRGNCDLWASEEPEDRLLNINGCRIFLTHGHRYRVKTGYLQLTLAAQEREAQVCCFGHTHRMESFVENGCLFLNPGSLLYPRQGKPGYLLLTVDGEGNPSADFYEI